MTLSTGPNVWPFSPLKPSSSARSGRTWPGSPRRRRRQREREGGEHAQDPGDLDHGRPDRQGRAAAPRLEREPGTDQDGHRSAPALTAAAATMERREARCCLLAATALLAAAIDPSSTRTGTMASAGARIAQSGLIPGCGRPARPRRWASSSRPRWPTRRRAPRRRRTRRAGSRSRPASPREADPRRPQQLQVGHRRRRVAGHRLADQEQRGEETGDRTPGVSRDFRSK